MRTKSRLLGKLGAPLDLLSWDPHPEAQQPRCSGIGPTTTQNAPSSCLSILLSVPHRKLQPLPSRNSTAPLVSLVSWKATLSLFPALTISKKGHLLLAVQFLLPRAVSPACQPLRSRAQPLNGFPGWGGGAGGQGETRGSPVPEGNESEASGKAGPRFLSLRKGKVMEMPLWVPAAESPSVTG